MQRYFETLIDARGNVQAGLSVLVKIGGQNATIYSDDGVTVQANPMVSDASGVISFYAANGTYDLSLVAASGSVTALRSQIILFDPLDCEDATPTSSDTVLGVQGGVVKRFAITESGAVEPLARHASLAALIAEGKPFVIPAATAYDFGTIGPCLGTVNAADIATIGTDELVTNGTFTGASTGWTLSNFTYSANAIGHTAGTVGTASQSVTVSQYKIYLCSVTLTTTAAGDIDLTIGGEEVLDNTTITFPIQSATTYELCWMAPNDGAQTLLFTTDTAWEGTIDTVSLIEVAEELPLSHVAISGDDTTSRIPHGLKFGRFNAGNYALGDRQTLALASSTATWSVAIGARALSTQRTGLENTATGSFALQYCNTSYNAAFGYSAAKYTTTGSGVAAFGFKAVYQNISGVRNSGFGFHSLFASRTASDCSSFGWQSLYSSVLSNNSAFGSQTAMNCVGSSNTYVGARAGYLNSDVNTTYSYSYGTAVGAESKVYGEDGTAIGYLARVGADGSPVDNAIAIGANTVNRIQDSAVIGTGHNSAKISGRLHSRNSLASSSYAAGITYTASQFVDSVLLSRSGPAGPFSDTTPTAAQIVAAIPGCEVGTGYSFYIRNTTAQTLTLVAGTGVTLAGTTTVAGTKTRFYIVRATNVTASSEAVDVVGVSSADN